MSTGQTPGYHTSEDEQTLHRLGYAQELFRAMGGFQNFAISFTIISILAGCLTSYAIGYEQGGPVVGHLGLAARRPHGDDHRARDGRDRIGLPDRRRALLLGVEARKPRLGLGDRLVQPDRSDRGDRGDRLRARDVRRCCSTTGSTTTPGMDDWFGATANASIYILYAVFMLAACVINLFNIRITAG